MGAVQEGEGEGLLLRNNTWHLLVPHRTRYRRRVLLIVLVVIIVGSVCICTRGAFHPFFHPFASISC